jgi:D-alanyl-D-alanine carboxypeptidase
MNVGRSRIFGALSILRLHNSRLNSGNARITWLVAVFCLLPILVLAGCAQQYRSAGAAQSFAPTQYYPPPGPPDDPWGPYIREAAARYDIPEQWIRAVMNQESGGEEQAVSPVGAMGLMQIMPETYQELRDANELGGDPFDPHNNILAGAAYIREMYDRYGSPGFLAAYNAGPDRLDSYLAGGSDLPAETENYLAAVTPNLGSAVPMSGPLANYAVASSSGAVGPPTVTNFATGCDVDAAYDPDHPCTVETPVTLASSEQAEAPDEQVSAGGCNLDAAYDPENPCAPAAPAVTAPVQQVAVQQTMTAACDPNSAYDPGNPCTMATQAGPANSAIAVHQKAPSPVPAISESALYQPTAAVASQIPPANTMETAAPQPPGGTWAIQVGAFSSEGLARTVADGARAELPDQLSSAAISVPATTPFGGLVLYRARLINLSTKTALAACAQLNQRQLPCIVVPASAS